MKLVFTEEARRDLIRIGDWIAQDSPTRALSFVGELQAHCLTLVDQPSAHRLVPRWEARGVRRAVHGRYLIFYRVEADALVVLHVLSGAMDYEAILFPGG